MDYYKLIVGLDTIGDIGLKQGEPKQSVRTFFTKYKISEKEVKPNLQF